MNGNYTLLSSACYHEPEALEAFVLTQAEATMTRGVLSYRERSLNKRRSGGVTPFLLDRPLLSQEVRVPTFNVTGEMGSSRSGTRKERKKRCACFPLLDKKIPYRVYTADQSIKNNQIKSIMLPIFNQVQNRTNPVYQFRKN